jgi:hypothetical protein
VKVVGCVVGILAVLASATVLMAGERDGTADLPAIASSKVTNCSPAPCVLAPTQASEGGSLVNTSPIVANPLNATDLLLGSNDFNCESGLGFFISMDGGSAWNRTCSSLGAGLYEPGTGNPMVAYDRNGVAYIAAICYHEGYDTGLISIQSSTDGINWSQAVTALKQGKFPADPWLAVDTNVGSPYLNSLYVSAVVVSGASQNVNRLYVSHSNDGGATWQQVAVAVGEVSPDVDNYTHMTVGKDGTVYLTWMYCNSGPYFCEDDDAYMVFSKSTNGGNTWSTPVLTAKVRLNQEGIPNSDVGADNWPAIGVDNSNGPYAGNLYIVMYTWTGTYLRVQVVRSTDGGNTWSKPVPIAPPSDTHDQFFPWLSVSPTGLVGVSWLDRRNDPANIDYQAFAAISSDGGQTFPNVQLTTAFSSPDVNGYENNAWMGNYTGNTWDGPNYFIAAWMDSSNGVDMQDVVGGIRLK